MDTDPTQRCKRLSAGIEKHSSQISDDFEQERAWSTRDANLVLYSILSQADHTTEATHSLNPRRKRGSLPPEIILQILHDPTRWIVTSSKSWSFPPDPTMDRAVSTPRTSRTRLDAPLSPTTCTMALTAKETKHLRKLVFDFRYVWSSDAPRWVLYVSEVKYYEIVIRNNQDPSTETRFTFQLPHQRTSHFRLEHVRGQPLVDNLKEGDSILLRISPPNWYRVSEVTVEAWCVDDLSMGEDVN